MEASPTKSKADTELEFSFEGEGLLSKCVQKVELNLNARINQTKGPLGILKC